MASARPVPEKSYFRIGEVASIVGVEPHVLRYWEREFRGVRPTKSAKGQRVYSRKDVENLVRVRGLLYEEGFTIAGAKKKLHGGGEASSVPEASSSAQLLTPPSAEVASRAVAGEERPATRELTGGGRALWRQPLLEVRSEIESFLAKLEEA